jgi:predicted DNA-binding transcriptional regulator YafY
LAEAGLAEARAGRDGGYRLTRPPGQVPLLEVVEAAEGAFTLERCILRGGPCHWEQACAVHAAWSAAVQACRDSLRLRFDYRSHDGTSSIRTTEPHRLVHTGRRWYLIGWDVDRQDWRTYRADRLDPRTPTGPRFTPRTPPDPDISGYTSRAISTSAYRYQARFTLHVSAETAAERIAPTTGALEPIDEHSCTLRAGSNSLDELAIYVTTKGFDFQVHEPPELVEHVRTLAARLAGATD